MPYIRKASIQPLMAKGVWDCRRIDSSRMPSLIFDKKIHAICAYCWNNFLEMSFGFLQKVFSFVFISRFYSLEICNAYRITMVWFSMILNLDHPFITLNSFLLGNLPPIFSTYFSKSCICWPRLPNLSQIDWVDLYLYLIKFLYH